MRAQLFVEALDTIPIQSVQATKIMSMEYDDMNEIMNLLKHCNRPNIWQRVFYNAAIIREIQGRCIWSQALTEHLGWQARNPRMRRQSLFASG